MRTRTPVLGRLRQPRSIEASLMCVALTLEILVTRQLTVPRGMPVRVEST